MAGRRPISGRRAFGESRNTWVAVEAIEKTPDFLFIYVQANAAHGSRSPRETLLSSTRSSPRASQRPPSKPASASRESVPVGSDVGSGTAARVPKREDRNYPPSRLEPVVEMVADAVEKDASNADELDVHGACADRRLKGQQFERAAQVFGDGTQCSGPILSPP